MFRSTLPWLVRVSSIGPKDVVIVIDTSGSMSSGFRINHTKEAATWVINTLTEHDFAQVVDFNIGASSQILSCCPCTPQTRLHSKNSSLVWHLAACMLRMRFETAFEILQDSEGSAETSTGSARAILFLTDGAGDDPRSKIRDINGGPYGGRRAMPSNILIFTYTFEHRGECSNEGGSL